MSTEQEPAEDDREHSPRAAEPPSTLVEATARELGRLAMVASGRIEAVEQASREIHQSMERLAGVGESIEKLANALMVGVASKADLEKSDRAQDRKRRRALLIGAVFLALSLVSSVEATVSAMRGADQRRILIECTTPSQPGDVHECYENGLVQQQKAIQQIIDALRKDPTP